MARPRDLRARVHRRLDRFVGQASILGVTGTPAAKRNAIQSKGEAYRQDQRRERKLVPCPEVPRDWRRHA